MKTWLVKAFSNIFLRSRDIITTSCKCLAACMQALQHRFNVLKHYGIFLDFYEVFTVTFDMNLRFLVHAGWQKIFVNMYKPCRVSFFSSRRVEFGTMTRRLLRLRITAKVLVEAFVAHIVVWILLICYSILAILQIVLLTYRLRL